jgi:hypothetical protein
MTDQFSKVTDMLSAPMEQVIVALGTGIARAQRELDRYAIEIQREIEQDPVLSEAGLQATFYQIPRAELELTMAIVIEGEEPAQQRSGPQALPVTSTFKALPIKQLYFQPINATYTNQFDYDVNASSKLKLTVVPVPPPAADTSVTPRLSQEEVLNIVKDVLLTDTSLRTSINFNGRTRVWVILQYRLDGDQAIRLLLVVVDDDTGKIIKTEKSG